MPIGAFGWFTLLVSTSFLLELLPSTPPQAARNALALPTAMPLAAILRSTERLEIGSPLTSRSKKWSSDSSGIWFLPFDNKSMFWIPAGDNPVALF